jgi:TatD DNase family protein
MMALWTDSHAHLYELKNPAASCEVSSIPKEEDNCSRLLTPKQASGNAQALGFNDSALDDAVAAAQAAGVHRILNVATSLTSSISVVRQCARVSCIMGAVGISPFDITGAPQSWDREIMSLAHNSKIVAIGETGIDATNPNYPALNLQIEFFERHCSIAKSLDIPVIIHSRGCEQKALDICKNLGLRKAVFHCYTGPVDTMEKVIDAGYAVSFSGIVTFARSPLASLVQTIPLSSILIETDTPYLAPVPHRGKPNQPAWAALVGKRVAEIRQMDEQELAAAIEANFDRVFDVH